MQIKELIVYTIEVIIQLSEGPFRDSRKLKTISIRPIFQSWRGAAIISIPIPFGWGCPIPILIPGWNENDLIHPKSNSHIFLWIQFSNQIKILVTNQRLQWIWHLSEYYIFFENILHPIFSFW